ncbi:MAG: amidase family protein [Pseudomonadota bacterium]|nr:amidase family protein [Pseudomonadota bacterium]
MRHPCRPRSRRAFLRDASAAALGLAVGRGPPARAAPVLSEPDHALLELSAVQAVQAMATGAITAERYAGALLARCARLKSLNAFITLEPDRVLEDARDADRRRSRGAKIGRLHGLPIPVKDSFSTVQYPTTAGTPALKGFRTTTDAPLVATLRAEGAIVLGKTNLHELSFGWTSNNLAFGAVHNPYDFTRIPGGSSGGTAAAIAAHMAPLGLAEDTEGSIRVPAALCGLTGFRPTTRRYSTVGAVPASALFDQAGPHARCIADIELFDRVAARDEVAPRAADLKGTRLAVSRGYWFADLDPDVDRLTAEAIAKLRAAGAVIIEAEVPGLPPLLAQTADLVVDHDVRVELARFLASHGAKVSFDEIYAQASADIRAIFAHEVMPGSPAFVSQAAYDDAVNVYLPRLRATFKTYFARTGAAALVFPTTMVTAPRIGDEGQLRVGERLVSFDSAIGRNIAPGSRAGLPGLVIPAGITAAGLPTGIEFDGPAGTDRALLALGAQIEEVLGHVAPPRL